MPELVKQLECGSPNAMGMAAQGLALIALKSAEHHATVTQELVKLLASVNEAVRQRASEALRDMAAEEKPGERRVTSGGGAQQTAGLINLLKDGLKDARVEAQEYALWSLSSITDGASREAIISSGGIAPLIASLESGNLSALAQEHAVTVLSGLAPVGQNAMAIRETKGAIDTLVTLLSTGNAEAKEHAAMTLAHLARRADAGRRIGEAGGVTAFVTWLEDPTLGPEETAARGLSEIALDDHDMQTQIAEEGATRYLIGMVAAWSTAAQLPGATKHSIARALKLATVASGTLATLAKDNVVNQVLITEEGSIPPLLELVKDKESSCHENATMALCQLAQTEENQAAISKAGGIAPLVTLLSSTNEATQQYTSTALDSLAQDNIENQIALAKAGAIQPLIKLLGSDSKETQTHSVGVLLSLASHDEDSRNAVVKRLVAILEVRNATAQMKAAEALAVLAGRSSENRRAITTADAIAPLVRLLGDGRQVRANTPQERAAAVLADLARMGENKLAIVANGGVRPLVAMLSSDAPEARSQAAGALWHLAAIASSKTAIAEAGGIAPLVALLSDGSPDAQKWSTGALWHLASSAANKTAMVSAGAIAPLVAILSSDSLEACEYATAVLSEVARTQGGNKKAIVTAGGIKPLVQMLSEGSLMTQRHAACALWGLAEGKEGIYDKQIVEQGAVEHLLAMLLLSQPETTGFAAACMSCLCADPNARDLILASNGQQSLLGLLHSPTGWLRQQATEMLQLLGITFNKPEPARTAGRSASPRYTARGSPRGSPRKTNAASILAPPLAAQKMLPIRTTSSIDPEKDNPVVGELKKGDFAFLIERLEVTNDTWRARIALEPGGTAKGWVTQARDGVEFLIPESVSQLTTTLSKQNKFHFFSFQVNAATGYQGFA